MSSILKVDTIQDQSGNNIINENADTITIGASGDTITIPSGATIDTSGATLTLPTTIEVDTIEPQSGTTLTLGASGDTITIPSGATLTNSGTATGFGKVLQVVSTTKSDTFVSSIGSSYTDVTGLSVSITPSSASNKILIFSNIHVSVNEDVFALAQLLRNSTPISIGNSAGSRISTTVGIYLGTDAMFDTSGTVLAFNFLDAPATTSSITYKIQVKNNSATGRVIVNRGSIDADNASNFRATSAITAIEIAG